MGMSRGLYVLIAVLALAGAALWLATPGRSTRGPRATAEEPGAAADARTLPALATAHDPAADRLDSGERAAPGPPSRREAATGHEAELARAHWVHGRVLFPAGTPDDERAFVVADGRPFEDGSRHRVAVGPDGTFRVAFSEKTRAGHFELEARYLYMEESVRWKAGASAEIVLAPALGARIAGRVLPLPGTDAAAIGGKLE